MTPDQSKQLVGVLMAAYANSRPTEATADIYARMIRDLDHAPAKAAVARLMTTSKFLPSIAEIRAATVDEIQGPRRTGSEAWADVISEGRRVGAYGRPEFADDGTAECVRQMGWSNLMRSSNDAADRARFIELYDNLSTRQRSDMHAGRQLPAPKVGKLLTGVGGVVTMGTRKRKDDK